MKKLTTKLLIQALQKYEDKEVYIQCGYNRFDISIIADDVDFVLLITSDDANNPLQSTGNKVA